MATYRQIDTAYASAIRNKGKNPAFVEYDLHRCRNHRRVIAGLYDHSLRSSATAFIVYHPVIREVFSASMEMCIIAHWLVSYIRENLESSLTPFIFNNRIGGGLDRALNCLAGQIYEASGGYSRDCYVCVCDTKGYFPNAVQQHAYEMLERLLLTCKDAERDMQELIYVLNLTIYFNKQRITRKSPRQEWELLRPGKSVLEKPDGIGAFPGEMIMQMAMTCYCDPIFKWLESMGIRFTAYGDDTAFVVRRDNKDYFLGCVMPEYRKRMAEIGCTVHPHKFYFQHYTKGVRFCSQTIKMQRIYAGRRIVNSYFQKIKKCNMRVSPSRIGHVLSSLNSYAGILRNRNAYGILRDGCDMLSQAWKRYIRFDDVRNVFKACDGYRHNELLKLKYQIK